MTPEERATANTELEERETMAPDGPYPCPLHPGLQNQLNRMENKLDRGEGSFTEIKERLSCLEEGKRWEEKTGDRHEENLGHFGRAEVQQARMDGSQNVSVAVLNERFRGVAWQVGIIAGGLVGLANIVVAIVFKLWK